MSGSSKVKVCMCSIDCHNLYITQRIYIRSKMTKVQLIVNILQKAIGIYYDGKLVNSYTL